MNVNVPPLLGDNMKSCPLQTGQIILYQSLSKIAPIIILIFVDPALGRNDRAHFKNFVL